MQNRQGTLLLAIIIGTALSGCLVEKKNPEDIVTISRTTDFLHIYKANEFIDYNVQAIPNEEPFTVASGTLRVLWEQNLDLIDPINGTTKYPVLKETTTLTFTSNSELNASVIRYISQDDDDTSPTKGSITLHAIEDIGSTLYWPTAAGETNLSAPVISPVIFGSPLMPIGIDPLAAFASPVEFFVMDGCNAGTASCINEIYRFSDNFMVDNDTKEITTNIGIFKDPFELSFNGSVIDSGSSLAISILGDIRDACGTTGESTTHGGGKIFVMPEIGIIQMENTCTVSNTGKIMFYTFTLDNTNISF